MTPPYMGMELALGSMIHPIENWCVIKSRLNFMPIFGQNRNYDRWN